MSETTVLDDYELLSCIATGNTTQVWEVKHRGSQQSLAMKLLLPEAFSDPEQRNALKHEAKVGQSFQHPNLIRILDVVVTRDYGYFLMELFRSASLKQMLRSERPVAQGRLKKMMEGVCQALAHMHEKGWIHKDVKPDNILLTRAGDVRVIDFNLASRPAGALTKLMGGSKRQTIQGTRTYIAPELVRRKPLTVSADIYSLGVTMYEVLTGCPPFISGNPNELLMSHVRDIPDKPSSYNPNVAPEADAFAMRLLAKKPEDRPASMQEVFSEVRSLKFFLEDPEEYAARKAKEADDTYQDSVAARLDSRTDDQRDRSQDKPQTAASAKPKKPAPKPAPAPQPPTAQPPVPQHQQMPPGYGQPPPGYPPQGYPPGYPPPMPYYPGMPPQGQPVPGAPQGWPQGYPLPGHGMPPGYPPQPGQPGHMPPVSPGGAGAPQSPPGGAPPHGQPPPVAPPFGGAPVPPRQEQPAPSPQPAAPPQQTPQSDDDEEELPFMTDLPDVV